MTAARPSMRLLDDQRQAADRRDDGDADDDRQGDRGADPDQHAAQRVAPLELDQVGADDADDQGGFEAFAEADEERGGHGRVASGGRVAATWDQQGCMTSSFKVACHANLASPAKSVKRRCRVAGQSPPRISNRASFQLASTKPPTSTTASTTTLTAGPAGRPGRPRRAPPRARASPGGSTGTWSPRAARTGRPPRSGCRPGRAGAPAR